MKNLVSSPVGSRCHMVTLLVTAATAVGGCASTSRVGNVIHTPEVGAIVATVHVRGVT